MRKLLLLTILAALGPLAGAEVLRCADAAGNQSYTDGACPPGSRRTGQVAIPEAPTPAVPRERTDLPRSAPPPGAARPAAPETAARAPQAPSGPSGPVIIDSRGGGNTAPQGGAGGRNDETLVVDDGGYGYPYPYPYPGAGYPAPRPQRDMRPRLRQCDAAGCQDTQGNHYNRNGQLDRYPSFNGKTCQPVGTTTVCR